MKDSVLQEKKHFLKLLQKSQDDSMQDQEVRQITTCPICHQGNVYVKRVAIPLSGDCVISDFQFYCDHCGKDFSIQQVREDIVYHEPRTFVEQIYTPFGNIVASCNGMSIPMKCLMYTYEDEYADDTPEIVRIPVTRIEIDVRDYDEGDVITCGFNDEILEDCDADERSILKMAENEEVLLYFNAFDTEDGVNESFESDYCYSLYDFDEKGVSYIINETPDKQAIKNKGFLYHHLTIEVAWLKKSEYPAAEDILDRALMANIGFI